jgi:Domain of unknown function (DUF4845)
MRTHATQKGITMMGFAMLLCIVGFIAYVTMKLIPVYTEYFGVVKSMKGLQSEPNIETKSIEEIRANLNVKFDLQYVSDQHVPAKAIQLISSNGQRSLRIAYDIDVPFIYNIDLLIHFDKSVDLSHGATY